MALARKKTSLAVLAQIKQIEETSSSDYDREKLQERLAKLLAVLLLSVLAVQLKSK